MVVAAGWILLLLACAIPPRRRLEWLREWRAEVWHVYWLSRETGLPRVQAMIEFLLGAVADAAELFGSERGSRVEAARPWLWRVALLIAFVVSLVYANPASQLLWAVSFSYCLFLVFVRMRSVRWIWGHQWQPVTRSVIRVTWQFTLATAVLAWIVSHFNTAPDAMPGTRIFIVYCKVQFVLVLSQLIVEWAIRKQESRCPCCQHPLVQPVVIGSNVHAFLNPAGTEWTCEQGHGCMLRSTRAYEPVEFLLWYAW